MWTLWTRCGTGSVIGNNPRLMKCSNCQGYKIASISCNGKRFQKKVHRLVLLAFVGPCPDGMQTCHQDGDRANNSLKNLRWGTGSDNMADAKRHGTFPVGSKAIHSILIEADIPVIIEKINVGMSIADVAKTFGVNRQVVSAILRRKIWRHASEGIAITRRPTAIKLSSRSVEEIKRLSASGESYTSISRKFSVTITTISNVVNGRTWKPREFGLEQS